MSLAAVVVCWLGLWGRGDDAPTYERDVRPIFARRCVICHNARDAADLEISGGLALDSYDGVRKGSPKSPVVAAGKASASALHNRLMEKDLEKRMPLYEDPLPEPERLLIDRWIDGGAARGASVASVKNALPKASKRVVRTLDVKIPVDAKVPKGVPGLARDGAVELLLKVGPLPGVSAVAFSPDGRTLAVGTLSRVALWSLADGCPVAFLTDTPGPVHALVFSRDGRRLVVGSGLPARSGAVRVYAVPDGTLEQVFEGHKDVVYAIALRNDGCQLASAGFDSTVRLWNLADGSPAGVFRGHSDFVYEVAYAADGRSLLSASKDRSVKRFDATTLKGLVTYSDHDDDIFALAIRPDGRQFVSAGNEPQLRWWSIDGDKPAKKVGGHSGPVHQLAFSADGKRLISAGGDGSVRLWDGASGSMQRALAGASDWQYAAALSPDGHFAAAGGWDGLVRVWDADKGSLLATFLQPPGNADQQPDWLAVTPAGYSAGSASLLPLVRWKAGGVEVSGPTAAAGFVRADRVGQALRGEAVPPPFSTTKEPGK
jgi:WD40 repeat protein